MFETSERRTVEFPFFWREWHFSFFVLFLSGNASNNGNYFKPCKLFLRNKTGSFLRKARVTRHQHSVAWHLETRLRRRLGLTRPKQLSMVAWYLPSWYPLHARARWRLHLGVGVTTLLQAFSKDASYLQQQFCNLIPKFIYFRHVNLWFNKSPIVPQQVLLHF